MVRDEKIWSIRRTCIKANPQLWNDHGDILKRVISLSVAVPTKIGLADVLLAWKWIDEKKSPIEEQDTDALQASSEVTSKITQLWNVRRDDLFTQGDACIDFLATHLTYVSKRGRA